MTEPKFKVGDKVNCILTEEGFVEWQNATVTAVDPTWKSFPYTCICDAYPGEEGLFAEKELELANGH